jgi:hypothetical protein
LDVDPTSDSKKLQALEQMVNLTRGLIHDVAKLWGFTGMAA